MTTGEGIQFRHISIFFGIKIHVGSYRHNTYMYLIIPQYWTIAADSSPLGKYNFKADSRFLKEHSTINRCYYNSLRHCVLVGTFIQVSALLTVLVLCYEL